MKTVVALEDLKINAMYKVEGKKDQFFLCISIPKILQSIVFKEQTTK